MHRTQIGVSGWADGVRALDLARPMGVVPDYLSRASAALSRVALMEEFEAARLLPLRMEAVMAGVVMGMDFWMVVGRYVPPVKRTRRARRRARGRVMGPKRTRAERMAGHMVAKPALLKKGETYRLRAVRAGALYGRGVGELVYPAAVYVDEVGDMPALAALDATFTGCGSVAPCLQVPAVGHGPEIPVQAEPFDPGSLSTLKEAVESSGWGGTCTEQIVPQDVPVERRTRHRGRRRVQG